MDCFEYHFKNIEIPDFNPEFFSLWLSEVVKGYNFDLGDISYIFVSDSELYDMNVKYLNHDYYTDVITFNYNEGNSLSGDIFISYERVVDNANEFSSGNIKLELCRVVVHGLLHLIGFEDDTSEQKSEMRSEEDKCLSLIDVSRETLK